MVTFKLLTAEPLEGNAHVYLLNTLFRLSGIFMPRDFLISKWF